MKLWSFKLIGIVYFLIWIVIGSTSTTSCIDDVNVQQKGTDRYSESSQVIVPRANFTCSGRITGITASMRRVYNDGTDPYLEVWHPPTPGIGIFNKVGAVQLVESQVVEQVDDNGSTYHLVNMTINGTDRIEFEAGDVIGYYHPFRARYNVWSIKVAGYVAYRNNVSASQLLDSFNLNNHSFQNYRKPLLQLAIDIRCDILSTPSNGGMSCSSGREGVGYEGNTCSFTCNTGYELTGSDTRTCQSDGSWSGDETLCKQGCLASVNVYQGGHDVLRVDRQVIIPYVNCSNSDGRITHITASLSLNNNNGSEYPSFQVWRPMSGDPSVYERIGNEIVLEDSEVRAMDGYWLAEIVVSDNERIEFKSGDVIGCYHPSNVRYQVNTISGNGSSVYDCDGGNMTTVNISSGNCFLNTQQLLIQLLFDIRCDILSTSNGGISCSSGRVGVGYEGNTCSFTCNTGYELTGSDTRTCQSDGSWSGRNSVCRKGAPTCIDSVMVQQRGNKTFGSPRQVIVPRANFTCNGRITNITASMDRKHGDGNCPYFQVWHPSTPGSGTFIIVGEILLMESDIVQVGHDPNDHVTYWSVSISLNASQRIEFEAGDVVGYYHPPTPRYQVWSITAAGYRGYANNLTVPSDTINISTQNITGSNVQPLIQFTIDIRCDILSTPSNGGMSCSSGREGVGYEGDTCNFTCNTGYELTGSDTRTCQSDGSWCGGETTCQEGANDTLTITPSEALVPSTSIMVNISSSPFPTVTVVTSSAIFTSTSPSDSLVTPTATMGNDDTNNNGSMATSDNDDTNTIPIIIGPVLAVVCVLVVTSSVCICVIVHLRKHKIQKQNYSVKAATQHYWFDNENPSYEYIDDNQNKTDGHISAKRGSVVLRNPITVSDYEMPLLSLERARSTGYSFSFTNDYSEPVFDSEATPAQQNDGYSSPLNAAESLQPAHQAINTAAGNSLAFVPPARNLKLLLAQIKQSNAKMVSSTSLNTIKELGCGEFGVVTLATWSDDDTPKEVAVKTLNRHASSADKIKFIQEAVIMAQFFHDNIIKFHGMVTPDPVMIVLEFAKKGDLKNYLIQLQPDAQEGEKVPDTVPPLLLKFAIEIAAGMNYLSNKDFVHRDLAARNVLLTDQEVCKIADFGMSRDLQDDSYYITSGGKIPAKWTAPEALQHRKYSTFSDVWSFGCVLYEIWSLGCKPFADTPVKDILTVINSGYRLPPPPGCPKLMYKLMIRCWHPHSKSRPAFVLISKYLNKPDEELLHISEEDIQQYGEAAVELGNTALFNCEELYQELQSVYKECT